MCNTEHSQYDIVAYIVRFNIIELSSNVEKAALLFVINLSNAEATLPKHKNAKIFENHLNPVMLVFIG